MSPLTIGVLRAEEALEARLTFPPPPRPRSCRECGCTDDDCLGCIMRTGQPCYWVEEDLCSACVSASAEPVLCHACGCSAEDDPDRGWIRPKGREIYCLPCYSPFEGDQVLTLIEVQEGGAA